jgi:hypothetical protein
MWHLSLPVDFQTPFNRAGMKCNTADGLFTKSSIVRDGITDFKRD